MVINLNKIRIRDPRFLLLYPPLQFEQKEIAKPDGSLSLVYIAGALRQAGYEVKILDCSVGDEQTSLKETFFQTKPLSNGLFRIGMPARDILAWVDKYDVIGISSIFTPQTKMVLDLLQGIKKTFPEKLIIAGGVNARNLINRFFDWGADIIVLSEGEETIVQIAGALQKRGKLTDVAGIAFRNQLGREVINPVAQVISNLDRLPIPAWDLLPLSHYWDISRPHGGEFPQGKRIPYASIQTSRGCPFRCQYCHNSEEGKNSLSGNISKFRTKSISRVQEELEILKELGVEYIFIEDDSMLANKPRGLKLLKSISETGLKLLNVNGVNICHLYNHNPRHPEVDVELLEAFGEAGLRFVSLPFESASQRILNKYASSKWHVEKTDTLKLFKALEDFNLNASGNYMIGYPDETMDEIYETFLMARKHVDQGLNYALFFTVVPFPGSRLFNTAVRCGQLDADFDTDEMRWTKSIMKNLTVDSQALEHLRQLAWLLVNPPGYTHYKRNMTIKGNHSK